MSGLFGTTAAASATSNALGDLKSDVALSDPPTDTITALSFSPGQSQQDFLAISSWDNKVRIYEIAQNGQSQGRHAYEHSQPVFDCDFSKVRFRDALCVTQQNIQDRLKILTAMKQCRTEQRSPLPLPTKTSRSATSPPSRTLSSAPTTSRCARAASSTAAAPPWSSPAPGTRRSSTGTCASKGPPPRSSARSASTRPTSATTSASSAPPTATSTSSTSRTRPRFTRRSRAR